MLLYQVAEGRGDTAEESRLIFAHTMWVCDLYITIIVTILPNTL